ncbi:type 1 glutamine amidotransferase domain-containing protein [Pseudomonas sp. PDM32]|uniref:type 1 glutamine amidotransferase domain-containing protein n=1 Tax=Pseudomonas sp. PDM32 TaxID=2854768 RepID=UPI001C44C070|nr:type 1 glutamine amidotransferase domain-containing protein [Pseudomonas sp. PDM32]MBV7575101.1 type 1 glutamine amidotransferase domain-containing protein [Pseudomonas sp. PDM32]
MKTMTRIALTTALIATSVTANAGNVLVVLSDSATLDLKDGKTFATGFYLNELLQPVKMLLDAGHEVTFATPKGKAPTVDQTSIDKMYFNNDEATLETYKHLLDQLKLTVPEQSPVISLDRVEQIGYAHFDAVYIPGGHAPMQDLLHSPALGRLLVNFHDQGKTTALVCHGPIALLSTLTDSESFTRKVQAAKPVNASTDWIYAGYKMTVISNKEEQAAKGLLNGGEMRFYPQTALEKAGGLYNSNTANWTPYVVVDRELITGQNPASANEVGKVLLGRLK